MYRSTLLLLYLFFYSANCVSQVQYIFVQKIAVLGLNKTKKEVVFRELDFNENDTLSLIQLPKILEENEKRLLGTGLFTQVDLILKTWDQETNKAEILIVLKEGWTLFPYLILELADRNFNVWAKDFNYSFSRLNYGLAITESNLTGNKDRLKAKLQFGFTGKYEFFYEYPYLKNGWGLSANFLYAFNKEISTKTLENRPVFFKSLNGNNLLEQTRAAIAIIRRTNARNFHTFRVQYYGGKVDSLVSSTLNPDYFLHGTSSLKFFRLEYDFIYNNLVYPLYPEKGFRIRANIKKDGLTRSKNLNNTQAFVEFEKHWSLGNKFIFSSVNKAKANLQRNQMPYFINQALGYENDAITGYMLYVIDGTDYIYSRNAIKYKVFEKNYQVKNWVPQKFRPFNLKIFVRGSVDLAYVNEPTYFEKNPLANSLLVGTGPAIDIVLFHNAILSCDFSVNKKGEVGFFLNGGLQF